MRWDYRGRPGPPAGVREPRVRWAARGSAGVVRIRLARVFGKPGRLSNYPTPSGAGVRTNEAGTDDERGPPRPTRSTFSWHKRQKVERMEVRPGRAPGRSAPGAAPGPFRRDAARCSLPRKVERVGRKADGAQDLCAQRTPAKRPGRPRNHPPHPPPGPDRATSNLPPKPGRPQAPGGAGRVMHPSRRKSRPTPLGRRELGPRTRAGVLRRRRPVAVSSWWIEAPVLTQPETHQCRFGVTARARNGTIGRWRLCARSAGRGVSRALRS